MKKAVLLLSVLSFISAVKTYSQDTYHPFEHKKVLMKDSVDELEKLPALCRDILNNQSRKIYSYHLDSIVSVDYLYGTRKHVFYDWPNGLPYLYQNHYVDADDYYEIEYAYDNNNNLIISNTMWIYDYTTGNDIDYQQVEYFYDNNNMLIGYETRDKHNNGAWVNSAKRMYSYDANGNKVQEIQMQWQNNAWQNRYKSDYSYNYDGTTSFLLASKWSDDWVAYASGSYLYTAEGKLTSEIIQDYNAATDSWHNRTKYECFYDSFGNVTLEAYYKTSYDTLIEWKNYFQDAYLYNDKGENILLTEIYWVNNSWNTIYQTETDYDDNGNWIFWEESQSPSYQSEMKKTRKYICSYDEDNNLTFVQKYVYVTNYADSSYWVTNRCWDYEFDLSVLDDDIFYSQIAIEDMDNDFTTDGIVSQRNNMLTKRHIYSSLGGDARVTISYYYSEAETINNKTVVASSQLLYPNPVNDKLYLSSQTKNITSIELLDIKGNLISSYTSQAVLDVNHLKTGLYFVKIIYADGSMSVSKIIKKE